MVQFRSDADKARWLDGVCWIDSRLPEVRQAAEEITRDCSDPYEKGAAIVRWVRDHVTYTPDTWETGQLGERIADASVLLRERAEDCDGKARAVVALCRAAGLRARIVAVMDGDYFAHAAADVDTGEGWWDRAETIVEGAELGYDPALRRRHDGTLPIV